MLHHKTSFRQGLAQQTFQVPNGIVLVARARKQQAAVGWSTPLARSGRDYAALVATLGTALRLGALALRRLALRVGHLAVAWLLLRGCFAFVISYLGRALTPGDLDVEDLAGMKEKVPKGAFASAGLVERDGTGGELC
ncbi:hypothetical protein GQ53DRAFT_424620 [Thozetella sp. PMI_491]|nr:hypothetical protein GQ53DRAFT_424620 [Thozetella sp. PMI_491]